MSKNTKYVVRIRIFDNGDFYFIARECFKEKNSNSFKSISHNECVNSCSFLL